MTPEGERAIGARRALGRAGEMTDISPPSSLPRPTRRPWGWRRWNARDRGVAERESRGAPVDSLPRRRERDWERGERAVLGGARGLASRSPVNRLRRAKS